jgi:hypothetical protein
VTPLRPTRKTLTVAALGTTQTLASASSYYLPAILAGLIAAGLHVSKSLFSACSGRRCCCRRRLGRQSTDAAPLFFGLPMGRIGLGAWRCVGWAQPRRIGGAGILANTA